MDVFDQFIKHDLKVKYYARYTDDFVIVSESKEYLVQLLPRIRSFLEEKLKIREYHTRKSRSLNLVVVLIILGMYYFLHFTLVRKRTQKRALRRINEKILLYKRRDIQR